MDFISYRKRFPFVPYGRYFLDGQEVEAISYPYPVDDANEDGPANIRVRTTPGDPTTMMEVSCADLYFASEVKSRDVE